jgi:hypothetical protein
MHLREALVSPNAISLYLGFQPARLWHSESTDGQGSDIASFQVGGGTSGATRACLTYMSKLTKAVLIYLCISQRLWFLLL